MSMHAPLAPLPIDDDLTTRTGNTAPSPDGVSWPVAVTAPTSAIDAATATAAGPAETRLRGERYKFHAVSVVGFPEGVSGDALTAFLRRFGPVQGPGGVRQVMHAWGLEVLLIFPTQEAATHAIDDIGKLVSLELGDRVVTLTSALSASVTNKPITKGTAAERHHQATAPATPDFAAMPVLVPIMPYGQPFYAHHIAAVPLSVPQPAPPPLPTGYVLVPSAFASHT